MTKLIDTPRERAARFAGRISISTISFAAALGGMKGAFEIEDGSLNSFELPGNKLFDLADFPRLVAERTGIRSIEICQIQTDEDGSGLEGYESILQDASVDVLAVALDLGNIASPDPARHGWSMEHIERWFDISARLGASFVRVSPGAPVGKANNDPVLQIASLRQLADKAAERDLVLLLENMGDPDWFVSLIEEVGRDRIGLILDIGNVEPMLTANMGRLTGHPLDETRIDFGPVYAGVAKLAPYATIVHAKVHDIIEGRFEPLDVPRLLRIIRDSGFRGPVTVECEGRSIGEQRWSDVEASIELVREIFGNSVDQVT